MFSYIAVRSWRIDIDVDGLFLCRSLTKAKGQMTELQIVSSV